MAARLDVGATWCPLKRLATSDLFVTCTFVMCIASAVALTTGCGFYSAAPISAQVIDSETREPLGNVNVVAAWEVKGGLEGGNVSGYVNVLETVTAADGTFSIPSWGPRINLYLGKIRLEAPQLFFFRGGYRFHTVANTGAVLGSAPSEMQSDWNGRTISLQRFSGPPAAYKQSLAMLSVYIGGLDRDGNNWPKIPQFLCALSVESELLAKQGVPDALYRSSFLKTRGVDCQRV